MAETELELLERLENDALTEFSRKVGEEHLLKMEMAAAVGTRDLVTAQRIEKKMESVTRDCIRLHGEYLHAKLNSAVAVKEDVFRMYGIEQPELFQELIAPMFDKEILEVQDAITRYREKYFNN